MNENTNELEILKFRAKQLGIKFREDIGIETLRQRIESRLSGENPKDEEEKKVTKEVSKRKVSNDVLLRQHLQKEKMKLVRIRITNMNPSKRDIPGEIITVSNHYLGEVRKFVPYGEHTENGYHVPYCIYTFLKNRKFQSIRTIKDRSKPFGVATRTEMVPEYAIEVLPNLSKKELDKLAASQAAAGGLN